MYTSYIWKLLLLAEQGVLDGFVSNNKNLWKTVVDDRRILSMIKKKINFPTFSRSQATFQE